MILDVEVTVPNMTVTKVVVKNPIAVNNYDYVVFMVVVTNTGSANLTNVTVYELPDENGLNFIGEYSYWDENSWESYCDAFGFDYDDWNAIEWDTGMWDGFYQNNKFFWDNYEDWINIEDSSDYYDRIDWNLVDDGQYEGDNWVYNPYNPSFVHVPILEPGQRELLFFKFHVNAT